MESQPVSASDYRWAVAKSEAESKHRLNNSQKRTWWSVVHQMLLKHHARPGEANCAECDASWPCGTVQGALQDLRSGALGY